MATKTVDESDGKRKREEAHEEPHREVDAAGVGGAACSEAGTAPVALLDRLRSARRRIGSGAGSAGAATGSVGPMSSAGRWCSPMCGPHTES